MDNNLVSIKKSVYKQYVRSRKKYEFIIRFMKDSGLTKSPYLEEALFCLENTTSQQFQEVFALSECQFKKAGFFVEFGVIDGILGSNTYLKENRKVNIDTNCVWERSGEILQFHEVPSGLSGINNFVSKENLLKHADVSVYDVSTISLNNLLDKYNAPNEIDYMSIDTEGSEFEILRSFDFYKYKIRVLTVEHNNDKVKRSNIYKLLTDNGYARKYEEHSQEDDWYILK
jgi:FkbM family methyltransferase